MNGAESLVNTLADQGVDICFANPGTSEMHFLAALENPRMRSVLCLFEGVATGAADGWYRMRDTPASHPAAPGPGLANGLANIHNAKRAGSGMVNIVGEHATAHLKYDAPLTSDIEGLARPLSHWVRRTDSSRSIAIDAAAAVAKASEHPGQIATLILPGNTSWSEAGEPPKIARAQAAINAPPLDRVEHVARVLKSGEPTLIVFGGKAMRGRALDLAGRVAAKTGARLATQFFSARIERGAGRVPLERIPYAVPQALAFLKGFKNIITVETVEPIAFFSYPDKPSRLKAADTVVHSLVETGENSILGLEMLLDALGGPDRRAAPAAAFGPGAADRQAGADQHRPRPGHGHARALHPGRRVPDHGAGVDGADGRRPAARHHPEHGRLDRLRHARRHRRGPGLSGPAGVLHGWRRQRHVHDPVAVDPGAREPERHDDHLRQPQLPDPQDRVRQHGLRRAGPAGAGDDRHRQAAHRLGGDGDQHGRALAPRHHGRRLPQEHGQLGPRDGPVLIEVAL
jgi:hypothetical protein